MRKIGPDKIGKRTRQVERFLQQLPEKLHKEFVSETPIRTGNAKKSTDLRGNEIQGNYNYANRLNTGWSSQAPQGMTDPTIEYARSLIRGLK